MKRRFGLLTCLVVGAAVLAACEMKQGSNSPTAPSTPAEELGDPAPSAAGPLVGSWTAAAAIPTAAPGAPAQLSSCSNFEWRVTSQTAKTATGPFSAVCLGAYHVTGTGSGELINGVAHLVIEASTTLPEVGVCPVRVTATGTLAGDIITLPFNAETCLGNFSGTQTLRKSQFLPDPPEPPAPPPPPPPPPPPAPAPEADEFDLRSARIVLGPANVADWPQTSTVLGTRSTNSELCVNHTKLGRWPTTLFFDTTALIEGSQWVFANVGGRWHGGAGEWIRPGQECKGVTPETIGRDAFASPSMEPLRSWVPRQGEVFGVMVTTPARAWPSMRTSDERSNVVLVRWAQ